MKRKNFLTLAVMLFTLIFSATTFAGIVTDRFPITCYSDKKIYTYDSPNGNRKGYIDANVDWIKITEARNGWFKCTYNGLKNPQYNARWIRMEDICADVGYSNRGVKVKGNQSVYITSTSGTRLGSVSNNEDVIVLADNGNRAQILYRLDNGTGFKMGWVSSSSVAENNNRTVVQNPVNPVQPVSRYATISNGWYKISSCRAPYRVLDVWGGGNRTDNGLQIQLWDWGNGNNQKFYVENVGNGYFTLKVGFCNKYVAAENGSGNLRTRVVLMDKNTNSATQQWRLVNAGNGSYYVESRIKQKLALDPKDAGNANEVPIQLWEYGNVDWNKWKFEPVSAPPTPTPSGDLQNLINQWNGKIWSNGKFSGYNAKTNPNVARECKEFAAYIFGQLFLGGKGYNNGGYIGGSKTNYDIYNQSKVGCRGIKTPRMTLAGVKELFQNAQPGDFIQMQRAYKNKKGNYGPHSAILVSKNGNEVTFFEANAKDKNGNYTYNKINVTTYTYDDLVTQNQAMSIYYAK